MRTLAIIALCMFWTSPLAAQDSRFRFPISGDRTASRGFAKSFIAGWCGYHLAVDVGINRQDTSVFPMARGTVKFSDEIVGYTVIIEHGLPAGDSAGPSVSSVYYHMKLPSAGGIQLKYGQGVTPNEPIGYISAVPKDNGNTAPHLHFGIRVGAYRSGIDSRTNKWFYPGYTTIYKPNPQGILVKQCDATDTVHQQVVSEWVDPLQFVADREGPANQPPTGSLDGGDNGLNQVFGWAIDPDDPNAQITVHLYIDKNASTPGATPIAVPANEFRSDVGPHAFNWDIPASLRDGQTHTVWAWGIDLTDPVDNSAPLPNSPKTFNIPPAPSTQFIPFAAGTYSTASSNIVGTAFLYDPLVPGGSVNSLTIAGPTGWNGNGALSIFRYQPPGIASQRAVSFWGIPPVTGTYNATGSVNGQSVAGTASINASTSLIPSQITSITASASSVTVNWNSSAAQSFIVYLHRDPVTSTPIAQQTVSGSTNSFTFTGLSLTVGTTYRAEVFSLSQDVVTPGPFQSVFNLGTSGTIAFTVNPSMTSSCPTTVRATDVPGMIPDGGQITSNLAVLGSGRIVDANLIFKFTHACESDLRMDLTAPDGTSIRVMDRGGMTCSGIASTFTSVNPTITEFLSGRPGGGVWTLTATDDSAGFVGALDSWSLTLRMSDGQGACNSADDDFDDDVLNSSLWRVQDPPLFGSTGIVTETNQHLEMANSAAGQSGAGAISRWWFDGDFDVQVDYQLLNWPGVNRHSVQLRAADVLTGAFGGVGVSRHSSGFSGEQYVAIFETYFTSRPTGDSSGILRLVRSGNALFAYAHDGTRWLFIGSGGTTTNRTRISLETGSGDPAAIGGILVAFDNFSINSGLAAAVDRENSICRGSTGGNCVFAGPEVSAFQSLAQTFTVGRQGLLSSIDLGLYKTPGTTTDVVLDIVPAASLTTFDLSASLARISIPISQLPECTPSPGLPVCIDRMVKIDLASAGLIVAPGQQLAIVLRRPGGVGSVIWESSNAPYTGGVQYGSLPSGSPWTPSVFLTGSTFRTWVAPVP